MAQRRIPLHELKVGMYVIGIDRSWLLTPFLRHHFRVRDSADIESLRRAGVAEVTIDAEQGLAAEPSVDLRPALPSEAPDSHTTSSQGASPSPIEGPVVLAESLALAKQRRTEWMGRLNRLFEGTRSTGLVSYTEACQLVEDMIGVILERQAACYAVISLQESDPTLYEHGVTVSMLSIILGQALSYPREALRQIGVGGLLHDIGLIRLPRNLIKRTKTMTAAQTALYDSHPTQGVVILEKSGITDEVILSMLRSHHDVIEASGAPPVLPAGREVPHRIVGVADQYDELLNGQSGLPPMSASQAMTQLYQRYQRQEYLQESVSYLIRTLGVYPLYSVVVLNTGEWGVVGAITPGKAHLPTVYLFRDAKGRSCVPPVEVDLSQEREGGRAIQDVRDPRREHVDIESILRRVAA